MNVLLSLAPLVVDPLDRNHVASYGKRTLDIRCVANATSPEYAIAIAEVVNSQRALIGLLREGHALAVIGDADQWHPWMKEVASALADVGVYL